MAGKYSDLFGTLGAFFKLGIAGPRLKNSSGVVHVRNSADGAFANLEAATLKSNDADIVLDADGNALTNSRNATQSGALQIIWPPAKATDGQVLAQKAGTGAGVIELELVTTGSTASSDKVDTTTLGFGTGSPLTLFSTGAADVITKVQIVVDTAFDGTPTVSIGIAGTVSKYMAATQVDLTATAGTVFEVHPGMTAQGAEALIATYAAGGASAGSARVLVYFATPQ